MHISLGREGGIPSNPIPMATPRGLARLKMTLEMTKLLTVREDWAMLRPREKAITDLCTMTAMKRERS